MKNPRFHITAIFSILMIVASFNASADHNIRKSWIGDKMIGGYDMVAYFTMGKAMQGSKDFSVEWLGGNWLFANAEHRELFLADPGKYIPQYGGYCSVSSSFGGHGPADPNAWQIVDGKLYLFASIETMSNWEPHFGSTKAADKAWDKAKDGLMQQ